MAPITEVEGRRVALSNLDKVLYPASGFTKAELLHYYATVADVLLPHLRDRPVSFLRYPDGPDGQLFFTKNVPPGTPDWVTTAEVPRSEGPARMVLVQDLPSLMWAANQVAEFHTHQWVAAEPGEADRLVFDLDPGPPATVVDCCEVALWLRERLAGDGIAAYAKTSGAKGLHLLAGVRGASSERVSEYAKALAVEAERALPELVVHRMTRSLRPGKVFVDWSQNAARKTTAAPYTVRARTEPGVSAPVTWEEVAECRTAREMAFVPADLPPRLAGLGDLLAPLFDREAAGTLPPSA
ncbi:non-homologous end-joining DNA ligase [Streptomyces griseoviridis]|uniref:Bifunctional non-homologous end joining protein LigD n=3 Tax=Streptomyces TaxID=1883 RepID=A0ABT9LLA2_STRGD|nr:MULTISPECIES: non-homologous end-joining DNA ligase [Streptomyces]MDP9684066.1 bifunctional non-homologous end joining protein LigD [Streptomyces griseoviridis]GGS27401.1 ATP-dependent DNA ligase [Streptomyces niveoruber]GGS84579.1 ATP-dependent DNA ligase [Streptomyces griseoviridis]GGU45672.1 ATP-dependent DNA ligase [Streptomyces daghestanicus]GHI30978.1 ATP-dependent DNA ligase [Streptomyces daghestanicus]